MTSEINIYRSAHVLIREHGDDAAMEAGQRADAMFEKGDLEGKTVWLRVLHAVEEIQRKERREDEATHLLGRYRDLRGYAVEICA